MSKTNHEILFQSKTTEEFLTEITSLQTEIKVLAKSQVDMTEHTKNQQEELDKVLRLNTDLERKYQDVLERERRLEKLHADMEKKLLETNVESIQVSSNLQDTHKWFKSKFDQLHEDVQCRAKMQQLASKKAVGDVPSHDKMSQLDETTEKAKTMIQASRETISRLANYATLSQRESSSQLQAMREKLETERSRALHMEKKLKTFQESSLRHTEELARELDFLKQHSTASYDSS
ncbi:hypothetical protein LSAT2_028503 [Lamellibrachia satsuma]|nr:hypothetical protein LSAT2_028503 [Lamellibrachia satsuma]